MSIRVSIQGADSAAVQEMVEAELVNANGKSRVRTLDWSDVKDLVKAALAGEFISRHYNGGNVNNSYRGVATATEVKIAADGETLVFDAYRTPMGRGAYGSGRQGWLNWEMPTDASVAIVRTDTVTDAIYHCLADDDARKAYREGVLQRIKTWADSLGLSSRRASGGSEICLHTDSYFRVVDKTLGKRIAERYAVIRGDLALSGYATQERDADGKLYWEHGETIEACHAEAVRKRELAAENARVKALDARQQRKARLLARLSTKLAATFTDALAVGYCDSGISSWCAARGIDPSGSVPIATLANDTDRRAQMVALAVARKCISNS